MALLRLALAACAALLLGGCTVITIGAVAVGAAVTAGSLAVDAGVGAVKLTGAAVGAAADVVLPSGDEDQ